MQVQEHDTLVWYFRDSSSDLGFRAQQYGEVVSGGAEQRFPTPRQCWAARRQRQIRAVLRGLRSEHQAALEAAYEVRPMALQLRHEHGMAAGLVMRLLVERAGRGRRGREELAGEIARAHALLTAAHEAFTVEMRARCGSHGAGAGNSS